MITKPSNSNPQKYNAALAKAIEVADRVVIKEHSHKVDFFGTAAGIYSPPEYVYAQKELSPGEKIMFLESVRKLKGEVDNENTYCLFEPHHTIEFYEQGQLKSSMEICYKCSDIQWNGSSEESSKDVFDALTPAIRRAGMETERDWDTMAEERYEEENKPQPAEPDPVNVGPPTAKWAPGHVGKKVINPFTGKQVDVEGIPANTKVRDPNDKDPTHIFRVPEN
ncbi:MAG: hypothetical protein ACSHX6_16330 [Akkermansiaceae bacterium]